MLCLRFRTFSLTKINRFCGGWKATKVSIQIVLILGYAKYFFLQRKRLYINQNRNFYLLILMNNDEAKVIFRLLPNV